MNGIDFLYLSSEGLYRVGYAMLWNCTGREVVTHPIDSDIDIRFAEHTKAPL